MNSNDDEDLFFDEEDDLFVEEEGTVSPWVMLVVDDEPDIHSITKLALNQFTFEGRGLEILSAHSGTEALEILKGRDDVAVILLDVVMESDHAGLDVARLVRSELENETVRIVLRTGQPGQAPEMEVILAYDINDYRAKTELTKERLFTTVISALRNYNSILELNQYRNDAYEMLSQNTKAVQSMIDLSDQALFQLGLEFDIQRSNHAFAKIFDKIPEDLIGIGLDELGEAALLDACKAKKSGTVKLKGQTFELNFESFEDRLSGALKAVVAL